MSTETDAAAEPEPEEHPLEQMVQPTIKFVLAFLALIVAQEIVFWMPATSEVSTSIPASSQPISVAQILHIGITLLLIGVILNFGKDIGNMLHEVSETFVKLKRMSILIASIIALATAYQLFRWVVEVFPISDAHYNVAFLIVGLLLGGWVVLIMYGNIDRL